LIKESFDKITTALETRITECEKYLANIKTTEDLANMTLKDLSALREFCKKESAVMTEIIMVDFYHIIGMGNLTAIQEAKFIKQMKKYLSFRTNMKSLASQLNTLSLDDLPEIPAKSRFKLKALCDLTLYSSKEAEQDDSTAFEETATMADYGVAKMQIKDATNTEVKTNAVEINPQTAVIQVNNVEWFINKVVSSVAGLKVDKVTSAINSHSKVLGIQFLSGNCAENVARGIVSPCSMSTVKRALGMAA